MNPKYCDIGLWEDKVIEEASEVITELSNLIKEICKAKRFGIDTYHPDEAKITNRVKILREIGDLRYAVDAYEKELMDDMNE